MPRIVRIEEANSARVVIVFPDDSGGVIVRRVPLRGQTPSAALAEIPLVLSVRTRALRIPILSVTVRLVDLGGAEGVDAFVFGPPHDQGAFCAVRARRELGREPALLEPELVVRASGDVEVPLPRGEWALEHAQALNELWNDEVRVRIAVAVEVAGLVDGDTANRDLDVLPFARVEPAEEDLLGVALAALVLQHDARAQSLRTSLALAWGTSLSSPTRMRKSLRALDGRRSTAAHVHLFRRWRRGRRSTGRRGRRGRRRSQRRGRGRVTLVLPPEDRRRCRERRSRWASAQCRQAASGGQSGTAP